MDYWERHRLHEIERALETEDPELAERLAAAPRPPPVDGKHRRMNELMVAGAVVALLGLLVHPVLFALGLTVALTAFWMRVGLAALDRQSPEQRDEGDCGGGTGALR